MTDETGYGVLTDAQWAELSRASWLGQRKGHPLGVQCVDCLVDGSVERIGVREGLMGEVMCLEIAPDAFDVIQVRRIFGQPFDGEPVRAGGQRCA